MCGERGMRGWRVEWTSGGAWCREKNNVETEEDNPRMCDVMSVMMYVMFFFLLLLFALFTSLFTVISGSTHIMVVY